MAHGPLVLFLFELSGRPSTFSPPSLNKKGSIYASENFLFTAASFAAIYLNLFLTSILRIDIILLCVSFTALQYGLFTLSHSLLYINKLYTHTFFPLC